jgi:hypoxanthine phosphoribosyltransferase
MWQLGMPKYRISAFYAQRKQMNKINHVQALTFACELVSWHSVAQLSNRVAQKIEQDGFKPDIVIAIARGGYVPARILCDRLDIYNLTSIRIAHYTGGSTKLEQARLSMPLAIEIKGMNVLLVDDVTDTGDTFRLALEHVKSFAPQTIKTAVIHHKTISELVPDYYATMIRKWRWIIYPWAVTEDICGFISKMSPSPRSYDEIREFLQQHYALTLSVKRLREIYPSAIQ